MKFRILLLVFWAFAGDIKIDTFVQVQIVADSYTIKNLTTYYLSIKPSYSITLGSAIQIVFPSEFTSLPSGQVSCKFTGISSYLAYPCSFSSNNLTFSGCLASSSSTFTLDISGIINPAYAVTTGSFKIYQYDSSWNLIQQAISGVTITIKPGLMGTVSILPSSDIIAASCSWTISFTLNYGVSSGGVLQISTPI